MSRPAQNRPEWTCTCGCSNFSDRKACRRCGAPKKPHQPGLKKTPPTKGPPTRGAAPESSVAPVPPKPWPARLDSSETARRPAPEAAAAEAEARAAALEQSAAQLRAVGLTSQAESLEQQASAERKSAESAPPAGKRLDLLEGFLRRAEGRLAKAAKRVEDAEVELAAARSARDALDSELNNGREQLAKFKKELTEGMRWTRKRQLWRRTRRRRALARKPPTPLPVQTLTWKPAARLSRSAFTNSRRRLGRLFSKDAKNLLHWTPSWTNQPPSSCRTAFSDGCANRLLQRPARPHAHRRRRRPRRRRAATAPEHLDEPYLYGHFLYPLGLRGAFGPSRHPPWQRAAAPASRRMCSLSRRSSAWRL